MPLPKKLLRARWLPVALAAYLGLMAAIGYDDWVAGRTGSLTYWGVIIFTAACIAALAALQRRQRPKP